MGGVRVWQWFVEGDLRSYTLHMARAVAEHQQAAPSLPPVAPPPRAKTGGSGPIGLPSACLQLRRSRAELANARQEAAEGMAGALDPSIDTKGGSIDKPDWDSSGSGRLKRGLAIRGCQEQSPLLFTALETRVPIESVAQSHDDFSRMFQRN